MTDRREILDTAASLIGGERQQDYGTPAENFARIGNLWAEVFGYPVSPVQVALCMAQVKVARLINSPDHLDSWVDGAGYLALGGEIATANPKREPSVVPWLSASCQDAEWIRDTSGSRYWFAGDSWWYRGPNTRSMGGAEQDVRWRMPYEPGAADGETSLFTEVIE